MNVSHNASSLIGWRKILATILPIVVAAINATVAGANVQLPADYEVSTLIIWGITILATYLPTIIAAISSGYYVKKNVEQDAFHTETSASVAIAQSKSSVVPAPAAVAPASAVQPSATTMQPSDSTAQTVSMPDTTPAPVFYSYADADSMAAEVEASLKRDNAFTPVALAYAFRSRVLNFSLSNVRPCDRVKQAAELVGMSKELFDQAITSYTGSRAPTWDEYSNIPKLQFRYKQDYERTNNIPCSGRSMEEINGLLHTMEDFVRYKAGLELIGDTPSESLLWHNIMAGGRDINAFDVFEYAGSLIPALPEQVAAVKKSK